MTCPKCNIENKSGSKFCIKCGTPLEIDSSTNIELSTPTNLNNETVLNEQSFTSTNLNNGAVSNEPPVHPNIPQSEQPINYATNNARTTEVSNAPLNYLMYIVAVLLKPFKCFKEEESKLCNTKTSLIFSSIVAGAMMLINLISSMISAIFVKTMDYSTFQYKTTMEFSNLKNLDYLSLIGKNLLIYAGVIVAIALVYYLAGLVFKKSVNFIKMLSISATSILPYVVLGMIVSPLIGKIWAPLSIVAMVVGAVYSILIFFNLINEELHFDNVDTKIYFHLICFSILGVAGYYLYINLLMGGISSDINDILDMFN